jgi:ABC-type amino acid transport substrate-binding protein
MMYIQQYIVKEINGRQSPAPRGAGQGWGVSIKQTVNVQKDGGDRIPHQSALTLCDTPTLPSPSRGRSSIGYFVLRLLGFVVAAITLIALSAQAQDAALERIQKNNEINCAVYVLGTIFSYDKAGKPQGFTVDLMNEISKRTGMNVRYTEISSFATIKQDLDSGKMDMVCSPVLLIPATVFKFLPGKMLAQDPVNIYTDGGANISDIKSFSQLNDPKYTFVGMDGELGGMYVPRLFPKAKLTVLSQGSLPAQMFMELHTKKANFVILSNMAAQAYLKENPGKLKQVTKDHFIDTSIRFLYPAESHHLKASIDAVLDEVESEGILDQLLTKHGFKS